MNQEIFIPINIFKKLDFEIVNKLKQSDKDISKELNRWIELDYKIETYKLINGTLKTIVKKVIAL